jgi:uncharacterized protein YcsI (UPF0317 family)
MDATVRGETDGRNTPLTRGDLAGASAGEVRRAIRDRRWQTVTHGLARGYVQANLAIVPERYAFDFMRFCHRNPKPCPLVDVTDPGDPEPKGVAPGGDLRTDLSGYRVYRDGRFAEERSDISALWRKDHVGFLLGCSLSVDQAMVDAGIPLRHLERDDAEIPVYKSTIACRPAGVFSGPLVVSMRPIRRDLVVKAVEVTSRYPIAHGAPVHIGDGAAIGIADIEKPDWSYCIPPAADEVPLFFACGVTPQAIAMASGIPEMITHSAGHMFITDIRLGAAAVLN